MDTAQRDPPLTGKGEEWAKVGKTQLPSRWAPETPCAWAPVPELRGGYPMRF